MTRRVLLPYVKTNFCSLPCIKESVEWVSMRGLERGGFVLVKEKKVSLQVKTKTGGQK